MKAVFGVLALTLLVAAVVARPKDEKASKDAAKDTKSPVDGVKNQVDGVKNQVEGVKKPIDQITKGAGNIKAPTDTVGNIVPGGKKGGGKSGNAVSDGVNGITNTFEAALNAGEKIIDDLFQL